MTMVERVALAISGGDDPASILSIHRSRARLAIEAMREPSKKMVDAAVSSDWAHPRYIWPVMIDAALSGKSK